ncbi:MAG: DciA family protein [Pasteurellaceae bacterium]|nr:DciA family protein [Pasteurellaceae bacterium]
MNDEKMGQRYKKIVNIKDVLQKSSLGKIMQRGLFLNDLNQQIQTIFPNQFNGLYKIVNLEQNELRIDVANGTVRQGFLLRQNELLALVQTHFPDISRLVFRVNPELNR